MLTTADCRYDLLKVGITLAISSGITPAIDTPSPLRDFTHEVRVAFPGWTPKCYAFPLTVRHLLKLLTGAN